jgi:hypothetical protein
VKDTHEDVPQVRSEPSTVTNAVGEKLLPKAFPVMVIVPPPLVAEFLGLVEMSSWPFANANKAKKKAHKA